MVTTLSSAGAGDSPSLPPLLSAGSTLLDLAGRMVGASSSSTVHPGYMTTSTLSPTTTDPDVSFKSAQSDFINASFNDNNNNNNNNNDDGLFNNNSIANNISSLYNSTDDVFNQTSSALSSYIINNDSSLFSLFDSTVNNINTHNGSLNLTDGGGGGDGGSNATSFTLSDGEKASLIVLYSLTTLLSICGNVLVVLVFTRGRRCRTDIRPFLINLAVADLVMALFCMPFTFTFVMMKTWVFSKPMCPLVLFVQHLSVSASVFTNMAIGSDRFLVVMFPLKSRVTTDRAKYVLVGIWVCAIALSSVQLAVGKAGEVPDGLGGVLVTCDERWGSQRARRTFTMFVLFITYIIPLTILAVAYSIVGVLLWRRTTPGNADETRDMHQLQAKRKVRVVGLTWRSVA